ncbi:MAG: hypothetical protein J6T54_12460 [Fibrobacter sp.]|nr:hypothetical protein [Fibrobacter sp.]
MANNEDIEIIKECQSFLKDSSDEFSTDVQRQTEQLEQFSGNFWTDSVCKQYRRTNKARPNLHFSNWEVMANAVVSPFSDSPFHVALEEQEDDADNSTQEGVDSYEHDNDSKTNELFAVKRAFVCGNGYYLLSVDKDELTGENKIIGEFVARQDSVAFDPNATAVDGSDAEQGAIVNYISTQKAKRLYGDGIVPMDYPSAMPTLDFTGIKQWSNEANKVQIVTYYRKKSRDIGEGKKRTYVEWFKICGNGIVDRGTLPIRYIPIIRFAGYAVYRGGAIRYTGIVDKTFSLQLGINIAYSTMVERAGRSVKANYITNVESVQGLEQYYKSMNEDDSLLVMYKGDKAPIQVQESFVTSDLSDMIANARNLLSDVVGVPLTGINGINETGKTATEVMQQQINSESNVANFYNNAYKACRTIGRIVIELVTGGEDRKFTLENGPAVITQDMKRRKELSAVAQLVPENLKSVIAIHYIDTLKSDYADKVKADIVANLPQDISLVSEKPEDPVAIHELKRMQSICEQMQLQIETLEQKNEELQKQYESAELSLLNNRENINADMQKFVISEQNRMNLETAKLQTQNAKVAGELALKNKQVNAEIQRTGVETEKVAMETARQFSEDMGV